MSESCPTCGRPLPVNRPKYQTAEDRLAGVRAAHHARTKARAERDARELLPLLEETFTSADLGLACRRQGRFWSDAQAATGRLERFGYIIRDVDRMKGTRMIRAWKRTEKTQ